MGLRLLVSETSSVKQHFLIALAAVLLIAIFETLFLNSLDSLENQYSDYLQRTLAESQQPDKDIVIIDIDEKSLVKMAETEGRWPWSRAIHAELIEGLMQQQPSAIVFDVLFSDADKQHADSDAWLAEIALRYDNLFFPILLIATKLSPEWPKYGEQFGFEKIMEKPSVADMHSGIIFPYFPLNTINTLGTINFDVDEDGVGRNYRLYNDVGGWRIPSLPLKVADALKFSPVAQQDIRLHWRGRALSYQRVSYVEAYQSVLDGRLDQLAVDFTGKIIIIGTTASGLHDVRTTPVSSQHPGVEILATAIDNLKNGQYLYAIHSGIELLIFLLILVLVYGLFRIITNPLLIVASLMAVSLLMLGGSYLAVEHLMIVPVIKPLLFGWLFFGILILINFLAKSAEQKRTVQIFSRFLDPYVVKELVGSDTSDITGSHSRELSVLFSDIRGFTSLSEKSEASDVVQLLNSYFSRQVKVIFKHGGTMDKFIGDAIMAFWGAPLCNDDHATNAVDAAVEMAETLENFRKTLGDAGRDFEIGIGIHTGEAVVGFIGFEQRMEYTCIGDTVNVASRIEGATKGRARILVSEETRQKYQGKLEFIDHGSITVKGREKPVHLFEPYRR